MQLEFRIFWLQYSNERICTDIADISSIQWALSWNLVAKYSAQPVCAVWTVVPNIYNAFTAPHIQTSIFKWKYLLWYWRYLDNTMCVILQIWFQIQRTFYGLRYVNCGPGHIQCSYSSEYSGCNIHLNISALLMEISRQFYERYAANSMPNTAHDHQFTQCELWSRTYSAFTAPHTQTSIFIWTYLRCYWISRQCNVRYTANMVPNTAYNLQITQCELWSRTYTI
jgi:hypothetical protein